jgi:hypothetical protein
MKQICFYKINLLVKKYVRSVSENLKLNYKYSIYAVCLILVLGVQSCSKMNDLHQPYLDEGEYIYAEKVDTVIVSSGRERIQLSIHVNSENIETVRVFWNNNLDSVDVNIDTQEGVFNKMIENLNEQEYIFNFISIDRYGNRSLLYEAGGTVYGDNFQNIISNRRILSGKFTNTNELTINWTVPNADVLLSSLTYTDTNDVQVTKEVLPTEEITVLQDFSRGLTYITAFLPNEAAIDTFYTESGALHKILLNNSEWSIADFSSEEAGGEGPVNGYVTAAIDGDLGSFWHTTWSTASPNYPHYFTIDLGSVKPIADFEIFRRRGNDGGATTHEFWVSSDNITFTKAATLNAKLDSDNSFLVEADDNTSGRYVKYLAVEGPSNYTHLAEINIYGQF